MKKNLAAVLLLNLLCLAACSRSGIQTTETASSELAETAANHAETRTASLDETEEILSGIIAGEGETIAPKNIVNESAVPVYAEDILKGVYEIDADSSSSMFSVESAELHVEKDGMYVVMTMGGKGYLYIYPGTPEEAAAAPEQEYISFVETEEGTHTFTLPVEVLNVGVDCAAFSKNKGKWYGRKLVFKTDRIGTEYFRKDFFTTPKSLGLSDGIYSIEVVLEGGSGRASVMSPCTFTVSGGEASVRIEFSSKNYDYLILGGQKYLPVNTAGNSVFEIPLTVLDYPVNIRADTTAMSTPHEIEYTLCFTSGSIQPVKSGEERILPLKYAKEYSVLFHEDGSYTITIGEDSFQFDHTFENIYLAASSAMDLFLKAGAIDSVSMTGTKASDWGIAEVRKLVEDEKIVFAGKYSAPDYEYLLSEGCELAVESTMIYHNPETKEKLESLGIPVLVDRSSYEDDPLGRMEWIKLYGVLTGHLREASVFFDEKVKELDGLSNTGDTGKTVAYFYINTRGQAVVRKPGDYICRMIEMAGGTYFLSETMGEDNMLSTSNMQMEAFLAAAKEADILIYNSSIDGELKDIGSLTEKDKLFSEFKSVHDGNVWCTGKNMYQETSAIADIIMEMNQIISGSTGDGSKLKYLYQLN